MKQKFDIQRQSVMDMVSALTAPIAKKNNISPDLLWASEDEYAQLDVFYHEAITALEKKLARNVSPTAKFEYFEEGKDYSLVVDLSPRWNSSLKPLVLNKLQEYLVHAILSRWIATFPGDISAVDYTELTVADMPAIVDLLLRVSFSQYGDERIADGITFEGDGDGDFPDKNKRHLDCGIVRTDIDNKDKHKFIII